MQIEKTNSASSITECLNEYKIDLQREKRELLSSLKRETSALTVNRLRQRLQEVREELKKLNAEESEFT